MAQLLAVSAMTSGYLYQENYSHTRALEELQRCAGTLFDPLVVSATTIVLTNRFYENKFTRTREASTSYYSIG